jgi:glycogen debranching enzyme
MTDHKYERTVPTADPLFIRDAEYVADTRPLCQGMPFVLTDAAHPRIVLKHDSHFLVLDNAANIPDCNTLGYGYYRYDTRHLSQYEMTLDDTEMSLLSNAVEEGYAGTFLYTNVQAGNILQQKITVRREVVLSDLLWERITIENFHNQPATCELKFSFGSDFADMFEVRGLNRSGRGTRMLPIAGKDGKSVFLAYRGQDGVLAETVIEFVGITPDSINEGQVLFKLNLPVRQAVQFEIRFSTIWDQKVFGSNEYKIGYEAARELADERYRKWQEHNARVVTTHEFFDHHLERNYRDIFMLRQQTPRGYGLAAGIPWYAAIFGRDSAITALQIVPFMPEVSKECIQILAAYQGSKEDEFKAESPGRIMHELRLGECARTGQIPHSPYYGTIDATQLWLMLLCEYVSWTADLEFARQLWPNVKLALQWIDRTMRDGYLYYQRESDQGLENQGWKDSGDAVMHTDGRLAPPPIAICEAQGYLYKAKRELGQLASLLGDSKMSDELRLDAAQLKERFQKDFWIDSQDYIAMAIDGDGRKVESISSNPGHCLWTEILDGEKGQLAADRLMSHELHGGWGIRTLSSASVAFNPVSYHNGSVWPHDNAIIAAGMRNLGRINDVHRLMQSMFEVAQHEEDFRLPELFCGFEQDGSYRPINYPVSCSPQAWATGCTFQILRSCMNLIPDACKGRLKIVDASFPPWLEKVTVHGLRIGNATVDIGFNTENEYTSCQLLRKSGNVRIVVEN